MEKEIQNTNKTSLLGIDLENIKLLDFQGEKSKVFSAQSRLFGTVIIKTAVTEQGVQAISVEEIKRNLIGYEFIPKEFCPDILAVDEGKTTLIMKHAGLPLRDLLWKNKNDSLSCQKIVADFGFNLEKLINQTKSNSAGQECKDYLEKIASRGNLFLNNNFFPQSLKLGFEKILNMATLNNESIGAFASMDATQGNLLIDPVKSTLKLIDPKLPRMVNGIPNFIGIPEIDFGTFLVTVELNSPEILQKLNLAEDLTTIAKTIHNKDEDIKLYIDIGKIFGCILISSFPNTVDRVRKYLKPFGVELDTKKENDVLIERDRHIDKALEIINEH